MITSFEVGSVFQIVDKASPVLARLSREMGDFAKLVSATKKDLQSLGTVSFGKLGANLKTASDQVAGLSTAVDKASGNMVAATDRATLSVKALADEFRAAALAARGVATAANASAVGVGARSPRNLLGGGGRGTGLSATGPRFQIPGGHLSTHGNTAAMVGAGALAYGIYEESELEDAAFRAVFTAGMPQNKNEQQKRMKEFRDIISATSAKTGTSIKDLSEAALTEVRQFAGFSWQEKMTALPNVLTYGAAEAKLKGTSVEEGTNALIGMAHMLKAYSPDEIGKLADRFGYLSTLDPRSLTQMERSAGYATPFLQSALGIDPFQTLELQSILARSGVLSTKSGTWIREMATRAMPGTSYMSKFAFKKHEGALKELGLVDDHDKPTWFTDDKPDLMKMLSIASEHAQKIPIAQRAGLERQLFGAQGSGALAVLADPRIQQMLPQISKEMEQFKTGADFFKDYGSNSPIQQFRETWADLRNVLMDIGTAVLPTVTKLMREFDSGLKGLEETLGKGTLGTLVAAGLGAMAGAKVAGPAGAIVGGVVGAAAANAPDVNKMQTESWGTWWQNIKSNPGYNLFGIGQPSPGGDQVKQGVESGSEKGSEAGSEKGTEKGIMGGLKSLMDSIAGKSTVPIGLGDYGTGASSMSGGSLLASGQLGSGASPMGPLSIPSSALSGYSGSSGAQRLMSDLIHKYGWSKEAAAVMAGNVQFESGFKTGSIGDGGTSFGLAQWHADRARRLMSEARSHGVDWRNWDLQLALMDREWRERYGDSVTSHDFNKLAYLGKRYEGYSTNTFGGRVGAASRYYRGYDENVIPPRNRVIENHVEAKLHVDGRLMAKNTTKYITKFGQHPAAGARLPDYTGTRPYTIGGD